MIVLDEKGAEKIGQILARLEHHGDHIEKMENEINTLFKKNTDTMERLATVTERLEAVLRKMNEEQDRKDENQGKRKINSIVLGVIIAVSGSVFTAIMMKVLDLTF